MPVAALPGNFEMYYEAHNFTDPWSEPEILILHHGNAKILSCGMPGCRC